MPPVATTTTRAAATATPPSTGERTASTAPLSLRCPFPETWKTEAQTMREIYPRLAGSAVFLFVAACLLPSPELRAQSQDHRDHHRDHPAGGAPAVPGGAPAVPPRAY